MAVYAIRNHHRSQLIADAMAAGIAASGDHVTRRYEDSYRGDVDHDVVVFYGLAGNMPQIFADYRTRARAVYVDLGYWGRREGGRWTGYHKVVVDARHPTEYFRRHIHAANRISRFNVVPQPWRANGRHILLAGMGDKGAEAEGYAPEQWERETIATLRAHSTRPIVYRPKPSWKTARPIEGADYSAPHARELAEDLRDCWAVVTHHSNVAVDALVAGIPTFCWQGVAAELSLQDLSRIEDPHYPGGRASWLADIAYCQWSVAEMKHGAPWHHLKSEKLIP